MPHKNRRRAPLGYIKSVTAQKQYSYNSAQQAHSLAHTLVWRSKLLFNEVTISRYITENRRHLSDMNRLVFMEELSLVLLLSLYAHYFYYY